MLMHFFVWTEFQGIGDEPQAGSGDVFGVAEVWEGLGRAGRIWDIHKGASGTWIYLSAANKLCLILFDLGTSLSSNFFST